MNYEAKKKTCAAAFHRSCIYLSIHMVSSRLMSLSQWLFFSMGEWCSGVLMRDYTSLLIWWTYLSAHELTWAFMDLLERSLTYLSIDWFTWVCGLLKHAWIYLSIHWCTRAFKNQKNPANCDAMFEIFVCCPYEWMLGILYPCLTHSLCNV